MSDRVSTGAVAREDEGSPSGLAFMLFLPGEWLRPAGQGTSGRGETSRAGATLPHHSAPVKTDPPIKAGLGALWQDD